MRGKLMCIMAHPDDAEIWCGGTILSNYENGTTRILVESVSSERKAEAENSAVKLGAEVKTFPRLDENTCKIEIINFRPDTIITHNIKDMHPDHRRVATAVLDAIFDARISCGFPERLLFCDTYGSLLIDGQVRGDEIFAIDDHIDAKMSAIKCHNSQPTEYFAEMARRQNSFWGLRIGAKYAEPFDRVPVMGKLPSSKGL